MESLYFESHSNCSTYDPYALDSIFKDNFALNILHLNIRSVNRNINELKLYLSSIRMYFSVIVLTETWLGCEEDWSDFEWLNYECYHSVRMNRRGGGVTILADRALGCLSIGDLCVVNQTYESCSVSFKINNVNYIIVGIYRPPASSLLNFNQSFFNMINTRSILNSNTTILGDFNIDMLHDTNTIQEEIFKTEFNTFHFMPIITVPTRESDHVSSLIDHIWVNTLSPSRSGAVSIPITDHFPVFVSFPNVFRKNDDFVSIRYRFSNENCIAEMKAKLGGFCDSFCVFDDLSMDQRINIFCDALANIYDECFPVKTKRISVKRFKCPWLTSSILRCINKKHSLYRDMRAGRVEPVYYRQYRNITCSMINSAKDKFYRNKFHACVGDIRKTWKCINTVIGKGNAGGQQKYNINEGNLCISDDVVVADIFNRYFAAVGENIANSIPDSVISPLRFVNHNIHTFFLQPTSPQEVISIVKSFKSKPCNVDSIPNYIYKHIVEIFAGIISNLINESFISGKFPQKFKTGRVIALHKKGSKNIKSNYRPISTIHTLGKVFEKSMYDRLFTFTNKFNLISDKQYGFRRSFSTSDSLLNFTNAIYNSLNSKSNAVAVSLDYQKAFDCLNHEILIRKLHKLGIRGIPLDWFKSYLYNRNQFVVVNGHSSSLTNITTGCPQGSVLSSLIFLLYIDDMHRCTPNLHFTHYADDTLVYYMHDSFQSLSNILNSGLNDISIWLKCNKLLLNTDKSNYLIFSNKKSIPDLNIKIDNTNIERVKSIKFLGVIIDEKISFAEHIQQTKTKISRAAGIMYKLSTVVPTTTLKCLYSSLVYSHLTYGVEVWGGSSSSRVSRIISIQNKCVSLLSTSAHASLPEVYKQNNLMTFDNIHKFFTLVKFHKYLQKGNAIVSQLRTTQSNHSHSTRFANNQNFIVPPINISRYFSSFVYQSVNNYNDLPVHIKNLNVSKFKKCIKNMLI